MENGQRSRIKTIIQRIQQSLLGKRKIGNRTSKTTRIPIPAVQLTSKSLEKKEKIHIPSPPVLFNPFLKFCNLFLGKLPSAGKGCQEKGKGTLKGFLHKVLALQRQVILVGDKGGDNTMLILKNTSVA